MEIPFVSENFQRAFRHTFKSQTSTGRDLHVSDIVIPVVDFTPEAAGTSLPSNLQSSLSRSTSNLSVTSSGLATLFSNAGFYQIQVVGASQGTGDLTSAIWSYDGSTYVGLKAYLLKGNSNASGNFLDTVIVFNKSGLSIGHDSTIPTNGEIRFYWSQLADVNGNLVNPDGYFPQ